MAGADVLCQAPPANSLTGPAVVQSDAPEPDAANGRKWLGPRALPRDPASVKRSDYTPPMRYRWLWERMKIAPSDTAIDARVTPSRRLAASWRNVRPGAITVVTPSSL